MTEKVVDYHCRGIGQWCGAWPEGVLSMWPGNVAG